jgi:hypothetical protein
MSEPTVMENYARAIRQLAYTSNGGLCVAVGSLAAMGGPDKGTPAALRNHGIEPTGDLREDLRLHLAFHGLNRG